VRQVMWDGIDCHRAPMLGWIAESVDLEPLRFIHLRPQGASQKGIWTGRLRTGFGQYFKGTSPLYHLAVVVYHLPAYPVLIAANIKARSKVGSTITTARSNRCHLRKWPSESPVARAHFDALLSLPQ
jgi:hypothetical protein